MKSEQIERITKALQDKGFGYISKDDCRKIILIVQGELIVEAVFTRLEPQPPTGEQELLPCWHCEKSVKEVYFTEDYYCYVICRNCGATGPHVFTQEQQWPYKLAVRLWNTRAKV
jgi:hypothetical protein